MQKLLVIPSSQSTTFDKNGKEIPGGLPSAQPMGRTGVGARSAQLETPLAYIRRRIAEIVGKRGDNPRPLLRRQGNHPVIRDT